jgi:membrane fusion protein (multidrug efflux system)
MQPIPILLTCLAGLALASCEQQAAAQHDSAGRYLAMHPVRQDVEITRQYVAQVRAIQHIELRAQVHGYLQEIHVDEGQAVEHGQHLFQVIPLLYQAEFQRAQAEAAYTRIEYENTKLLADDQVVSPNELALAKAKLDKADAELELAKVHLDFTAIRAPFDGIMGRFLVRKGSLVEEGELLSTLADNSTMWVYFNVTESEYLTYQAREADDSVLPLRLAMANGEVFGQPGKIDTIEADFNNETGNIAFRASFPNPDRLLRHGQTGNVLMSVALQGALLIPQKATFEILDQRFVFVVDGQGVVHQRAVVVAAELPQLFVVSEGLEEGDVVLLEGLRKVRDGADVDVDVLDPEEAFASLEAPTR